MLWSCQHLVAKTQGGAAILKTHKVNTVWFRDRLAERDMSLRRLAKLLELDPSAVSLMLRGKRTITSQEANKISGLLTIPVTEVLRQAGVLVNENMRQMVLKATINKQGQLSAIESKNPRRLAAPDNVPFNGSAAQVRAPKSIFDGWVLFAGAADSRIDALVNRLCFIELAASATVVGTLLRGYEEKKHNIVPLMVDATIGFESVVVKAAAPVLWILPV